jgi:hypothetical protein
VGAVKWEVAAVAAYMTVSQIIVTKETRSFHFPGRGMVREVDANLGIDKLTHAFNGYLIAEGCRRASSARPASTAAAR